MPPQEDILILKEAALWWTLVPAIFIASEAVSLLLIFWKEIPKEDDKAQRIEEGEEVQDGSLCSKCNIKM